MNKNLAYFYREEQRIKAKEIRKLKMLFFEALDLCENDEDKKTIIRKIEDLNKELKQFIGQ